MQTTIDAPTQENAILTRLRETPGEWVPMPELARVSGSLNVHTRIDGLRHKRGLTIENSVVRAKDGTCANHSSYRIISA